MGYFKVGDRVEIIGIYRELPCYYLDQVKIGSKGTVIKVHSFGVDVKFNDLNPHIKESLNFVPFIPLWDNDDDSEELVDIDLQGVVVLGKLNAPKSKTQVKSIKIEAPIVVTDNSEDCMEVTIITDKGHICGKTCKCYKGCNDTWDITNLIGRKFAGMNGLLHYLEEKRKGNQSESER